MKTHWKVLIVSIVFYQIFLTWVVFGLVNTAARFGWSECEWERCGKPWMGYLRANQDGYTITNIWMAVTLLLITINAIIWIRHYNQSQKLIKGPADE